MLKEQVIKAYHFAQKKHNGQKRAFVGLPYFTHPKFVARTIEILTNNETLICAALLHDVLEDTQTTDEQLDAAFDSEVCRIVRELTSDKTESKKIGKTAYLTNKMLNMSEDALTVKLADRYHNVLFLESDKVPTSFIKKYTIETNDILRVIVEKRERLTRIQRALILRILSIIMFIQIRFKLELEIPLICL